MTSREHREELRRICATRPDDGPFVRELAALLCPDAEDDTGLSQEIQDYLVRRENS